jgi:hypothetical protein
MKRYLLPALILVVGISASAQDPAVPPAGAPAAGEVANPYYPLKAESVWSYKVTGGPITVKVAKEKETVKGVACYKVETSAGGKVAATELVAFTKDGVMRYSVNGLQPDAPIMFLKAGAKKGDSWAVDTKVSGQTVKGTFNVTEEKVKIGDKEYDTLVVKGDDMEIGSTKTSVAYWFAKDVGIVKLKFTLGTQDAVLELESFTPGK